MKRPSLLFSIFLLLAIGLQACNMPSGQPAAQPTAAVPSTDEPIKVELNEALTLAAQTIAAGATLTPTPTETGTITITPSPTNTEIVGVTVTVNSDTNCRMGPSTDYDVVMLFTPGMSAKVVGRYGGSYWIIEYPGGFGATCWLWGQYATVIGNTASLVESVPPPLPPTPTIVPVAPAPPKGVHYTCNAVQKSKKEGMILKIWWEWTIKIQWKDQSNNENGFSVYMDGSLLGTVGPNQASFTHKIRQPIMIAPTPHNFAVQSFNDYGTSPMKDVLVNSCN